MGCGKCGLKNGSMSKGRSNKNRLDQELATICKKLIEENKAEKEWALALGPFQQLVKSYKEDRQTYAPLSLAWSALDS